MTIGERLKRLRKDSGYTLEEAGLQVGLSKQNLYKYESGIITNIPSNKIEALANLYKCSPAYIMGWDKLQNIGYPIKKDQTSCDINDVPEKYEISKKTPGKDLTINPRTEKGIKIPVLGRVAAGIPIEAIEDIEDYEEIPESMALKGEYFALKIKGESMEPKFSEGDVVIVQKQDDVESGEIGVIIVNGSDATVKKVVKQDQGILLVSTNQNIFPPKYYDEKMITDLPVNILGKVVELRAKF